jgi:L-alanine-DL-glutamate epimerase-like enolase superfamily enzyme
VTDPVRSVEASTVVLPLPQALQLGQMTIERREYATVRVTTASGLTGSAYCLTRDAPVTEAVDRLVEPHAVGRDSGDIPGLRERYLRANVMVGRTGLAVRALGLVDVALWDVAAQREGAPLHRLLGRAAVPPRVMMVAAYPVAGRPPEELAADVAAYAREGYGLLKIARSGDTELMRRWLDELSTALPASAAVVVDAACAWSDAAEALGEVALWGETELAWLEDPLVPEDVEGLARLRREGPYPVGAGDDLSERLTCELLLDAGALDVLRIDTVAIGGVTTALELIDRAAAAGVTVSFHCFPELNVHLAAVTSGAVVETFDPTVPGGNPYDPAHLLSSGRLAVADGVAALPTAPGIGFELLELPG